MKYLVIDRVLKTFAGKEIKSGEEGGDGLVRIRDILIQYVGQLFDSKDKKETLLAFHIGHKIYDCTIGQLKLEDAEFDLVVKATNEPKGHGALIMGPIYEELDAAVKRAEELIAKTTAEKEAKSNVAEAERMAEVEDMTESEKEEKVKSGIEEAP